MTPQALLRLHPFFAGLAVDEARLLLARSTTRRYPAGRFVFQQGDPGNGLYGVLGGGIAFAVDSPEGKKLTLNVLGPGEFFGEIALLDGGGRTATAQAREASELLFISRKEFQAFVAERPGTLIPVVSALCEMLRRSTDYMADSAFLDLGRRLAKLLLRLSQNGADAAAPVRISHIELASMLGVSRERVSRQLAAWGGRRILDQQRGRLVVRDRGALQRVIGEGG